MTRNWKASTTLFLALISTSVVVASSLISSTSLSNNTRDIAAITAIEESGRGAGNGGAPATATEAIEANTEAPRKVTASSSKMKSISKSNNLRWAIHGVATELFHNVVFRTLHRLHIPCLFSRGERRLEIMKELHRNNITRQPPKHEIAVVTGATGGIGTQIALQLAIRGYDVVIAARDVVRGETLAAQIRGRIKVMPICNNSHQSENNTDDNGDLPTITFVEYHADVPQSAMQVASAVKGLGGSPLSILINNAGIMGQSEQLTMRVNLLGPAYLTFALIPLMATEAKRASPPTVINVGSSAHLRATRVCEGDWPTASERNNDDKHSWIDSLPDMLDSDLSIYASSKLALMQFSTILRHCLPASDPPIRILDAHPGLVWTSLLRNHIGDRAVRILTRTGLANAIYKSSSEGAHAIVSALDYAPPSVAVDEREQVYFVNGMPGGYASPESASYYSSLLLWKCALKPELEGFVEIPKVLALMEQKIEAMEYMIKAS